MYKNLEEFKKRYYPKKHEMERYALKQFIWYHCDSRSSTRLSNALHRAGIESIEDFVNADVNTIRNIRCIGEKGIEELMKARMYVTHIVEEL